MNQCVHDGLSKDANFKNTYTHVAPLLETKFTYDFFLTATEQPKARALLSIYFPRVLLMGTGGTTPCNRKGMKLASSIYPLF
jgi:hypothetical protein